MAELSEINADDVRADHVQPDVDTHVDVLVDESSKPFDASVPFDFSLKVEVPSVRATDTNTSLPPSLRSLLDSIDSNAEVNDDPWIEFEREQTTPRRKRRFLFF